MTLSSTKDPRFDGKNPVLSVVVPTYREAENLPELLERLGKVRAGNGIDLEVLIMDDNSRDGSEDAVAALGLSWVRFVVRTEDRGLSPAVIDGFRLAQGHTILVMDADLSHPPEKIPEMLAALDGGADFVIGSRYVPGASTAEDWGVMRWINSRIATLLARPFTRVSDPMSGFFAFRRALLDSAATFNAVGYKIGLEVIVKGRCTHCAEVPIHFDQRHHGESKLSLREQLLYLRHLRRLAMFKYGHWVHFSQFAVVGFLGTFVNLAVLTLLDEMGLPLKISAAAAIFIAMVFNFFLNRRFTFSDAQPGRVGKQLAAFIAACSVGAAVNYAVVLSAAWMWPLFGDHPQFASVLGIMAGLMFNYVASRHLVFKK
jgi:dolichol-phosphate mannosyltransferase